MSVLKSVVITLLRSVQGLLPARNGIVGVAAGCVLTTALTSGCATNELNSERIERLFGSYRVVVLEQTDDLRVSSLGSVEPEGFICRTFAIVRLHTPVAAPLIAAHREIVAGGSIGATLEEHGFRVRKDHLIVDGMEIQHGRATGAMGLQGKTMVARHVYALVAERDGSAFPYARLVELHHPDYFTATELRQRYRPPASAVGEPERREIDQLIAREVRWKNVK